MKRIRFSGRINQDLRASNQDDVKICHDDLTDTDVKICYDDLADTLA